MAAPGRQRWLAQAKLPASLLRFLGQLDVSALSLVARRLRAREEALVALLEAVAPSRRPALYEAAYADVDRSQALPSDQMLTVLPLHYRRARSRTHSRPRHGPR